MVAIKSPAIKTKVAIKKNRAPLSDLSSATRGSFLCSRPWRRANQEVPRFLFLLVVVGGLLQGVGGLLEEVEGLPEGVGGLPEGERVPGALAPSRRLQQVQCTDACSGVASDGDCDDGGPGSEYDFCPLGDDCTDCGERSSFPAPPVAPPPPIRPIGAISITGPCVLSGHCLTSPRFNVSNYGNDESCVISGVPPNPLEVLSFDVEFSLLCVYDYVEVNGQKYCGFSGPNGVRALDGVIIWFSDSSQNRPGWQICFAPSPPSLPPQPPSPPLVPPPPCTPPLPPSPPPAPPLSEGDCMITALNSATNGKNFAVLLLATLGPGQAIYITDDSWRTDVTPNAFRGYESHVFHVASVEEPAGTVLLGDDFNGLLSISSSADQLIVYRGSQVNPTFICALDNSGGFAALGCPGSFGGWHQSNCGDDTAMFTFYSALPAGLTIGVNAIELPHRSNWAYAGATTGRVSDLRAAIARIDSWTYSEWHPQPILQNFSVLPPLPPAPPSPPAPPVTPPSPPAAPPPPPLAPGDCLVVGYDSRSTINDFGILLLAPLGKGQVIWATDDGWDSTSNSI
ncbi:hypothetical protein AB1Y20_002526 [Prymnesium parvum]|uniref:CUB domain-containing protein n=1 Tax=Prymnesium parvum TaxID=97485 RepID=A0AB34JC30_PRYPA